MKKIRMERASETRQRERERERERQRERERESEKKHSICVYSHSRTRFVFSFCLPNVRERFERIHQFISIPFTFSLSFRFFSWSFASSYSLPLIPYVLLCVFRLVFYSFRDQARQGWGSSKRDSVWRDIHLLVRFTMFIGYVCRVGNLISVWWRIIINKMSRTRWPARETWIKLPAPGACSAEVVKQVD